MEKINQFSIQRFVLLMKRYVMFNIKSWLIGLGALSGVVIIVALLQTIFNAGNINMHNMIQLGQVIIFVGGFMLASMAYNEIHTPARSQFFLTLPATTAEKLFSHWFVTSIAFIIVANLMLSLTLVIAGTINYLAWNIPFEVFNPFAGKNPAMMLYFVVLHSIFFLGALYFRKNNFLKTILSLFVLQMIINVFIAIVGWILFGSFAIGGDFQMIDPHFGPFFTETAPMLARVMFFGVLAPFCLLVSYFRLKEREV